MIKGFIKLKYLTSFLFVLVLVINSNYPNWIPLMLLNLPLARVFYLYSLLSNH